jgi:glycogen(starch) synthase
MKRMGQQSSVLNVDPRAPESDAYIKISGAPGLLRELARHVCDDWSLNVHTNGHNPKSWFIALACGLAAQVGPEATLTLHSGLVPAYIRGSTFWKRQITRFACLLYTRIVCVNSEIAETVAQLGVARRQIEITPAFLPVDMPDVDLTPEIESWVKTHSPLLSATMFFRPEYGFDLLVTAMERLKKHFPDIGCVVMGSGEDRGAAEDLVARSGLSETLYLAGDLDHETCLALMARCAAFVRPTRRDGDSISVREAISMKVPVVASNVGTRPDGAVLFEVGDVDGFVKSIRTVLRGSIELAVRNS